MFKAVSRNPNEQILHSQNDMQWCYGWHTSHYTITLTIYM